MRGNNHGDTECGYVDRITGIIVGSERKCEERREGIVRGNNDSDYMSALEGIMRRNAASGERVMTRGQ